MPITIKNAEVEELAREASRIEGISLTAAIRKALELSLATEAGKRRIPALQETLLEMGKRVAAMPDLDTRSPDEILGYGNEGFPSHGG